MELWTELVTQERPASRQYSVSGHLLSAGQVGRAALTKEASKQVGRMSNVVGKCFDTQCRFRNKCSGYRTPSAPEGEQRAVVEVYQRGPVVLMEHSM